MDTTITPKISIIVAMASNRAIGYHNTLPWHIPEDLAHFKALTTGHTVIMGRRTFESLPHGALPMRRNVVVSRTLTHIPGCDVYPSLPAALDSCDLQEEVFIIGGESVYREALPLASTLYVTYIDGLPDHADAFFPETNWERWTETKKEKHNGFSFIVYQLNKLS